MLCSLSSRLLHLHLKKTISKNLFTVFCSLCSALTSSSKPSPYNSSFLHLVLPLNDAQVRREPSGYKWAAGPDCISARLLRSWAEQLCGVQLHMFGLRLNLGKVSLEAAPRLMQQRCQNWCWTLVGTNCLHSQGKDCETVTRINTWEFTWKTN